MPHASHVVHSALTRALDLPGTHAFDSEAVLADLPGASSLALARAMALLEEELRVDLYEESLAHIRTVGDLTTAVAGKLGSTGG
ncbi:acyl carrier protein [Crossiella equi]|uniref:Acyl carrier protein n=1 Tax=Crossiella equi TaxID=130796 RepID=A0ABS5A5R3_9PSEU|nr:hypothetical protein [Crossiella equi]MBP2471943.1 acyl carrier protein [Crossiella equi]